MGVRRGTALAVAHVGVELLIDTELARRDAHRDAYLGALASATRRRQEARLGARYRYLCRFLRLRGVSDRPPTARETTTRLDRALRARPRLRLVDGDHARVTAWIVADSPEVARTVPSIVAELEAALGVRFR
jgi:hypothetical protein